MRLNSNSGNFLPRYILLIAITVGIIVAFFLSGNNQESFFPDLGREDGDGSNDNDFPAVRLLPFPTPQEAIRLKSRGMIEPGRSSELSSNVSGVVEWVNPRFQAGEIFTKGEPLLRVGKQFYAVRVAEAKTDLEEAKLSLAEEQAEAMKAVRKWDNSSKSKGGSRSELVLRVPYRRAANARVESAQARLEYAEEELRNTTITAPYDCVIASKQVDLGMRISQGDPLGCVFSSKDREVRVSLSPQMIEALPRDEKGEVYSLVSAKSLDSEISGEWSGDVDRVSLQMDSQSQDMFIVAKLGANAALLPEFQVAPVNLMVDVDFQSHTTDRIFWVPMAAISGNSEIWVMTAEGLLARRKVLVEQMGKDRVLIMLQNKQSGERVCIEVPQEARVGMKVRDKDATSTPHSLKKN